MDAPVSPATTAQIQRVWERWGLPIVSLRRTYLPGDVEGLVLERQGELLGLVTWAVDDQGNPEIVSLDALVQGQGHGSRLIAAAEAELGRRGAGRVWLVTTNDNLDALRFYCRRGYRLLRVHLDAMDRVRRLKPDRVPLVGEGGLPLRDMWELAKDLGP